MFDFTIPLFPFESSAITLTTSVWIGVAFTVFFNLRLGWTLSGMVVPGYLAPILITRPVTGVVIMLEAVLTYWIIKNLALRARLHPYWSSFFGRDRFFAIVLVSVLVRAVFDGWLLPWFGQFLAEHYQLTFDYRNTLRSFGLIVVSLIANYFWKPGLARGILPICTTIVLTFLVIKFGLAQYTNFNVGNIMLLYNDVSTSLMASPKAYMIVITTAYIASQINLRYAWDFNGILIPALLGLLWYDPFKIIISAFECIIIYLIGITLLKTRFFRTFTMEGGVKLLYFFSICFVYRMLLCFIVPLFAPEAVLTDNFGFGYLLTTLMAIKAYDKKVLIRMLNATAQVSMTGAVVGSLIGFAFYCGPRITFPGTLPANVTPIAHIAVDTSAQHYTVADQIRQDKLLLYKTQVPGNVSRPLPAELALFRNNLQRIKNLKSIDEASLASIRADLQKIDYEVEVIKDRFLYLREPNDTRGWGIYVIDTANTDGLCIQVPNPTGEGAVVEASLCLFDQFNCRSLAIAGKALRWEEGVAVLKSLDTTFGTFHKVFGKDASVQVRGRKFKSKSRSGQKSRMLVRGQIPESFKLARLKELVGTFEIQWNSSGGRNAMRDDGLGNFIELDLTQDDFRRMIGNSRRQSTAYEATTSSDNHTGKPDHSVQPQNVYLASWLQDRKKRIVGQGTNAYVPALTEEVLYFDHEVISPLIQLIEQEADDYRLDLELINRAASVVGYRVHWIEDPLSGDEFFALAENDATIRGWGTYVFRTGNADPYAIEIPRPLFEFRSFDFGKNLFERTKAFCLMVGGAHPRANHDGTADMSKSSNRGNLYNLVRHVLFRDLGPKPLLVIQARAIQAPVDADIVIATNEGNCDESKLSPLKKTLLQELRNDNLTLAFVDGSENTAGYEVGILLQATSVQVSPNKEVVSLWLSPTLRSKFREQELTDGLSAQFDACGLQTIQTDLLHYLGLSNSATNNQNTNNTELPETLRKSIEQYSSDFDAVRLFRLVNEFDEWTFTRILDKASGQAYLVASHPQRAFPAIANITGATSMESIVVHKLNREVIESYIRSRCFWLEVKVQ